MTQILTTPSAPAAQEEDRERAIAFYLPQFHPIPENDAWWGKGFTEWTNVARAKPLFRGHVQPRVPADLGFYDLRVPETRAAQAEMARTCGVEGFCYWHYWFAGRRLLQRPFEEVLGSGEPDFPFCLGWANHSWTGVWYGAPNRVLIEQTYPGMDDHERHFRCLASAFADPRYIRVDGKPLLMVFRPKELPDSQRVFDLWRKLSDREGLGGLHVVAHLDDDEDGWGPLAAGYDAATVAKMKTIFSTRQLPLRQLALRHISRYRITRPFFQRRKRPLHVVPYRVVAPRLVVERELPYEYYPCVVPNWDNTPRSGSQGSVLTGSTPALYQRHLQAAVDRVASLTPSRRIVFIKSWNEWAEGNYLEPDQVHGHAYLEATGRVLKSKRLLVAS
jgi:hypothetical protein